MKQNKIRNPEIPWEHGSEFYWFVPDTEETEEIIPQKSVLFTSGRSAFFALLLKGQKDLGWKRLHVPAYYDYDVIKIVQKSGIEFSIYGDYPFEDPPPPPEVKKGDALLLYNTFGMRIREQYQNYYSLGIPIVEDHSHDPWCPWCRSSNADYVLLTLRKTLPIPDGGAIWSPKGSPLPPPPDPNKDISPAARKKLQAMLLKSLYFQFGKPKKEDYLEITEQGENSFLTDLDYPISSITKTVLRTFPWKEWRKERLKNFHILRELLKDLREIEIMEPASPQACPFVLLILFPNQTSRDQVRSTLHQQSIYATVIWPLTEKIDHWPDRKAVDYSERILVLHCDGRYEESDLERVADAFRSAIQQQHFKKLSVK